MRRRDRHDIALTILKAAKLPVRKTVLMYKARLSYDQLQKYLSFLMRRDLVENRRIERRGRHEILYKTTKKGQSFIDHLELVEELWQT